MVGDRCRYFHLCFAQMTSFCHYSSGLQARSHDAHGELLLDIFLVALRDEDSQAPTPALVALALALAVALMVADAAAAVFAVVVGCGIDERPAVAGRAQGCEERSRIGTPAVTVVVVAVVAVVDASDIAVDSHSCHGGTCEADDDWDNSALALTAAAAAARTVRAGNHVAAADSSVAASWLKDGLARAEPCREPKIPP